VSTINLSAEPLATKAWVADRLIYLQLADQRLFAFPASRFRRLKDASDDLLACVKIEVGGSALRWEELDEDITVAGVVAGRFELPPEVDSTTIN